MKISIKRNPEGKPTKGWLSGEEVKTKFASSIRKFTTTINFNLIDILFWPP